MVSEFRQQRDLERKERTRQQVLDAAQQVFITKGYHHTKISDIVAQAGVGQGTLYRSFKNKREVFETLFDEFMGALLAEFAEMSVHLPRDVREYRDASIAAITRAAGVIQASPDLVRLFLREGPSIDPEFAERLDNVLDRFADLARYHLDRAIEGGFARPCGSRIVAQALISIALRQTELFLNGRLGEIDVEELIRENVDFAFWGFGAQDKERREE